MRKRCCEEFLLSAKSIQRSEGLHARRALSNDERLSASTAIAENVFRTAFFCRATNIGCYLPARDEVDTWPIIKRAWLMKKRVFVPRIQKKSHMQLVRLKPESQLVSNIFGLDEPDEDEILPPMRLDLFLTPLAAYDLSGNRIGMGGGYFDRTFAFLSHRQLFLRPKLVGLAFACQEVHGIDASPWDIPLFSVLTENGPIQISTPVHR